MAEKKRKHSGKTHMNREAWERLNFVAFCRKVALHSTYPEGENGGVVIVEHVDPRAYPHVRPVTRRGRKQKAHESTT